MRRCNLHYRPLSLLAASYATNQSMSPFVFASNDLCDEAICTTVRFHYQQPSVPRTNPYRHLSLRATICATKPSALPSACITSSHLCHGPIRITICLCKQRSVQRTNPCHHLSPMAEYPWPTAKNISLTN
jgi:hypothetical protein